MRRSRPSAPRTSPYITPEGYLRLEKELKNIWVKRAEVTQALSAAAAEGDRSENAEYIYRKKELAGIDRRIRYLQRRLPSLNIVARVANAEQVFFGAWVTLENRHEKENTYRIVGSDEIDSDSNKGYISVDSPLARALLKKSVDDEILLNHDGQHQEYVITGIRYASQ